MREVDNANPSILNVSQLPSRSRKVTTPRQGPDSKCDNIVYSKRPWLCGSSSSEDEDLEEEYGEDPVDAQDIYGKHHTHPSLLIAFRIAYTSLASFDFLCLV